MNFLISIYFLKKINPDHILKIFEKKVVDDKPYKNEVEFKFKKQDNVGLYLFTLDIFFKTKNMMEKSREIKELLEKKLQNFYKETFASLEFEIVVGDVDNSVVERHKQNVDTFLKMESSDDIKGQQKEMLRLLISTINLEEDNKIKNELIKTFTVLSQIVKDDLISGEEKINVIIQENDANHTVALERYNENVNLVKKLLSQKAEIQNKIKDNTDDIEWKSF